jgi:putative Ca2+/H+ antiporter (TMEM165/GDT1 family)
MAQYALSPVFVQVFILTFLAEWGDRSQISTIVLAASQSPVGVAIGSILGHALCTAGAVIGGQMIASKISVKTVTLAGAILFLCFGVYTVWELLYGTPE